MHKYEEQLERIRRWFNRIYLLMNDTSTPFVREAECYSDEFHAFFIECHSMADWLRNDPGFGRSNEVSKYIRKTPSLQFCSDLANGKKHLQLIDGKRWNKNEPVDGLLFHFAVCNGNETTADVGSDRLGADKANQIRKTWQECDVPDEDITIAVFADIIVDGEASGSPFDGAIELAWDAYEAWCRFLGVAVNGSPKTDQA